MSIMRTPETITLGSGTFYAVEFTAENISADVKSLCTKENMLGATKGGATIDYKPTFNTVSDDSGAYQKTRLTAEEASVKGGIMTWNGETVKKLTPTAKVSMDENTKTRTTEIGGIANYDGKSYIIIFQHKDNVDGDVYIVINGVNSNGISIAFATDKESTIDPEFKCQPLDDKGVLIRMLEQTDTVAEG